MAFAYLLGLCLLFLVLCRADSLTKDQECFESIYEVYSGLLFAGSDASAYYVSTCTNPLKTCSMYASGKLYCTQHEIERATPVIESYCTEYGFVDLMPMSNCTGQYSIDDASIRSMRVINESAVSAEENFTEMVVISPSYFGLSHRTVDYWEYEINLHHTYGWAMYGFWGIVLLAGMTHNAVNTIWHAQKDRSASKKDGAQPRTMISSAAWHWLRMHVILPPVLGDRHRRLLYSFFVPTRLESFIIYSYWVISLILCAVNYRTFEGNLYWPLVYRQVWRYLADRTGIIAYANLPLLWMFASRNNIFIWATGWNYSTFSLFHRHIARVATVEAIVHSAAYTVLCVLDDDLAAFYAEPWFYLGVVATITMSLMLLLSSVWLQRKAYELFLLIHIAFAVVTVVGLFYHTSIFNGQYEPYLLPLVAIWCFDRFLRVVRLAYCNFRLAFTGDKIQMSRSVATYDSAADVIKLTITPTHAAFKPAPGQHYFIYRPLAWKGWENHPFTLGSWYDPKSYYQQSSLAMPSSESDALGKEIGRELTTEIDASTDSHSRSDHAPPNEQLELVFWLRPFDGWTRSLRDQCKRSSDGLSRSKILIEGPYGHDAKLHHYESLLLIAGGTGLSGVLPYLQQHIQRKSAGQVVHTHTVEMIWASKRPAYIHQVCSEELKTAIGRADTSLQFYSTATKHSTATSAELDRVETNEGATVEVPVNQGRPDIRAAVLQAARTYADSGSKVGRLAVLVCGPAGMTDEARAAVRKAMSAGCRNIEYIEETYGW